MNIIDYFLSSIPGLPNIVLIPGLVLCALLGLRAVGSFIGLRWIKAATSLVYIVIILLLMARFGEPIAQYLQETNTPQQDQQQS